MLTVKGTFDVKIMELSQYLLKMSDQIIFSEGQKYWMESKLAVAITQANFKNAMIFLNGACHALHADCWTGSMFHAKRKGLRKRAIQFFNEVLLRDPTFKLA